jgi:hypothetical protein
VEAAVGRFDTQYHLRDRTPHVAVPPPPRVETSAIGPSSRDRPTAGEKTRWASRLTGRFDLPVCDGSVRGVQGKEDNDNDSQCVVVRKDARDHNRDRYRCPPSLARPVPNRRRQVGRHIVNTVNTVNIS